MECYPSMMWYAHVKHGNSFDNFLFGMCGHIISCYIARHKNFTTLFLDFFQLIVVSEYDVFTR